MSRRPSPARSSIKLLVAACAALGVTLTVRRLSPICSDPACAAAIPVRVAACAGCDGTVSGDLLHASDRLAAEEALTAGSARRGW